MPRQMTIENAIKLWSDADGYHFSCKCCGESCAQAFNTRTKRTNAIVTHLGTCQSYNNVDGGKGK